MGLREDPGPQDAAARRRVKALTRSFPGVQEDQAWDILQACEQDISAAKQVPARLFSSSVRGLSLNTCLKASRWLPGAQW